MESNHMPLPRPTHDQKQHHPPPPASTTAALFEPLDRPFKLPTYPPPAYAQANDPAADTRGSDRQNTELPPIHAWPLRDDLKGDVSPVGLNSIGGKNNTNTTTLPSLSSLTATAPSAFSPSQTSQPPISSPAPAAPTHWPSLNPLAAYYTPSHVENAEPPMRMDLDSSSNSAASPDRFTDGRASSVTLDDPEVRMAAEALGELKADLVYSPPNRNTPLPSSPRSHSRGPHPEPLLSLLTTSHPLLAKTIEGATSTYNNSKNYSPRFKYGAEAVEGVVLPIANTVGSVGRRTGMESGVRWFLGGGRGRTRSARNLDIEQGSSKRRRMERSNLGAVEPTTIDPLTGAPRLSRASSHDRRLSVASTIDTLPAYDDAKSPPYAEHQASVEERSGGSAASRIMMSTSGLSIAMSEESLRSLKYCLSWLRWANVHIGNVIDSLKITMAKYEENEGDGDHPMVDVSSAELEERTQLAAKITGYRSDVLKTLQDVINTVSKYAGGALPENARELVRQHLTSLPQRFRLASAIEDGHQGNGQLPNVNENEGQEAQEQKTRESAQRVMVLAKEGLDMMAQVSGVLDGTIVSAEEWCERMGQKKREQREELLTGPRPVAPLAPLQDIKTGTD